MQVQRLRIDSHKCMVDFDVHFQTEQAGSSTILIGENGSGKSTFLDALLLILMSFDSDAVEKKINFNYELSYIHSGSEITILQAEKYYHINVNHRTTCEGSKKEVLDHLRTSGRNIFPSRVIHFYSGANDHSQAIMQRINVTYAKDCRQILQSYRDAISQGGIFAGDYPWRKYIDNSEKLTDIYALCILGGQTSYEKDYLMNLGNFSGIRRIDFSVRRKKLASIFNVPDTTDGALQYAMDLFVEFTDSHFSTAIHRGYKFADSQKLYYSIPDPSDFQLTPNALYNCFEKFQTLLDAEFNVYLDTGAEAVTCGDLSEGQRQIIKILGMLGVCKREDCLILMDEPDAHMNPRWKYDLKSTIDQSLVDAINTQVLIATHDPLVINGVEKEFIRIFTHNQDIFNANRRHITQVIEPQEDTTGLGIDGLLQSEYYGLQTSYDKKTTDKFLRRQTLYSKLISQDISDEEKAELRSLTKEIGFMPISSNSIDFLYDDFMQVFRRSELYRKKYLTYDEVIERRREIEEIINQLYEAQE